MIACVSRGLVSAGDIIVRASKGFINILGIIAIIVGVIIVVILLILPGIVFIGILIYVEIRDAFRGKRFLAAQEKEQSWVDQEPEDIFLAYRTGFRTWDMKKDGDEFVLRSQFFLEKSWPRHEKFIAHCRSEENHHKVPFPTCGCGIYAMDRKEDLVSKRRDTVRCTFLGEVKLWGVILRYTRGLRAQFAYPLSITEVRCSICGRYVGIEEASYYYSSGYPDGIVAFCTNEDSKVVLDSTHSFEKLDPSFLSQVAEDYGITIG